MSETTKHSPLPWEVITSRDVWPAVVSPGVATICIDIENEADAEFICRACNAHYDLLESCKSLLPILEAVRYTAGLGKTQLARIEKAKAAIAKAQPTQEATA